MSFLPVIEKVNSFKSPELFYTFLDHEGVTELGYISPRIAQFFQLEVASFEIDVEKKTIRIRNHFDTLEKRNKLFEEVSSRWRTIAELDELLNKGWRNEAYTIYNPTSVPYFYVERAFSVLIGVVTYGVHINGYIPLEQSSNGELKLWIPRRSLSKPTYPGMLDNTVAGGLETGRTLMETAVKECFEEAGLSEAFVKQNLRNAGVVSYIYLTEDGRVQPEVEFIYDLKFKEEDASIIQPQDGEAEDFQLMSYKEVITAVKGQRFKPNCALVIVDFLIRHGFEISSSRTEANLFGVREIIEEKIPEQLTDGGWTGTVDAVIRKVNAYEVFLKRITDLLSTSPIENHQILWIECIYELSSNLLTLKTAAFEQICSTNRESNIDQVSAIQTEYVKFIGKIMDLFKVCLSSNCIDKFTTRIQDLVIVLCMIISANDFELQNSRVDKVDDNKEKEKEEGGGGEEEGEEGLLSLILENVQTLVERTGGENLELLTEISKTLYLRDKSILIIPILHLYNPELPIDLLNKGISMNFADLINFYKFTAFNCVSVSLNSEPLDDSYSKRADIYFKILLSFPNLIINTSEEIADFSSDAIINLQLRQEISYLYVINYLLGLRRIEDFFDQSQTFKSEITFLLRSMSVSLSRDIEEQASQPGSRYSSVVNIPSLNFPAQSSIFMKKSTNLGAVINEGTYKEKLKLVVNFCETLSHSNLNSVPTMCEKLNELSFEPFGNWNASVTAIDKIRRLLILISIKQVYVTGGVNNFSIANLHHLYHVEDIENVFQVKDLLDYKVHNDTLTLIPKSQKISSESLIRPELETIRLTRKLKESV
ncbi:hypothetical protein KGF56_003531 [Candida oxycetoniae]|uniref:Nudix hydrolase domain-containing protein n=1 Tax=Candida oxycetoniae TaxID=497107 RepID=A0AAI9WX55_9ASCO|nr:uncharacterized protein KGF56_003531 [Candida oxycetoniae]KAI3403713.2 hypothetical protein KGF56_003531 [Candida oxycetoniae]